MAECMGLHRDGQTYGMNPLETHVRRLIWYQLCFLDIRTCEAQGPRPTIRRDEVSLYFKTAYVSCAADVSPGQTRPVRLDNPILTHTVRHKASTKRERCGLAPNRYGASSCGCLLRCHLCVDQV